MEKLEDSEYTIDNFNQEFDMDTLVDDVHLVTKNVLLYNSMHAEISRMAINSRPYLIDFFGKLIETQRIATEGQCRACGKREAATMLSIWTPLSIRSVSARPSKKLQHIVIVAHVRIKR